MHHEQALHEGGDDYGRLYSGLESLRCELQQLKDNNHILCVDGAPYKVELYMCSDLKATREMIGMEQIERCGAEHVQVRCVAHNTTMQV